MGIDIIKNIIQHSDASGSKSTILKPLTWLFSILIAALLAAFYLQLPSWIMYVFVIVLLATFTVIIFSYFFCLFNDRDALRSEKYSLKKMAIEKGIYGDSITGVLKSPADTDEPNLLNQAQKK
jgi:membrane protein YdbS with pleckstrin-like domain